MCEERREFFRKNNDVENQLRFIRFCLYLLFVTNA